MYGRSLTLEGQRHVPSRRGGLPNSPLPWRHALQHVFLPRCTRASLPVASPLLQSREHALDRNSCCGRRSRTGTDELSITLLAL